MSSTEGSPGRAVDQLSGSSAPIRYRRRVRKRMGLVASRAVPAAAVAAAVLAGVATAAAGANAFVAICTALAVLCLGGLLVLVVQHLRRVRRRLDRIDRALDKARWTTGGSTATPAAADITASRWVDGVPLPPDKLRFMGEDDAKFLKTADELAGLLASYGMKPDARVLDAGCGYGRLAVGLLRRTDFDGSYLGFDILPRHIAWCNGTLGKVNSRYAFTHVDLLNERYNPSGALDPNVAPFPAADASYDVCALFSVFTHLFEPTCQHYLDEIARTLQPGGVAVTTWLIFDDQRLPEVVADAAAYPLRLEHADGSRFMLAEDPLRAIGFHRDRIVAMAGQAGLSVATIQLGAWTGGASAQPGSQFQDLVVLTKP